MKRWLSLILAMLMLAMPVLGSAESVPMNPNSILEMLGTQSYTMKYMAQGQALTTDFSFQLGDFLMSQIPEDAKAPVSDLLNALKMETVTQTMDGEAQGTMRLLLNDENVLDVILAVNRNGLYGASSLLGNDTIVQLTPLQVKTLVNQGAEQLIASGQLPQELWDSAKNAYRSFRADPFAFLSSLVAGADPTNLLMALYALLSFNPMPVELTEIPEGVTIDAKMVSTVTLGKEALKNFTAELAKLIWSLPVTQKLAPYAKVGDQVLTEESLVNLMSQFPDALAEDLVINIYMTEDGKTVQVLTEIKLAINGTESTEKINAVIEAQDTGAHVSFQIQVPAQEEVSILGDVTVQATADGGQIEYDIMGIGKQNGTEYTPVEELGKIVWTQEANRNTMSAEVKASIQPAPNSQIVGVNFSFAQEETDLGDHAEQTASGAVSMDGLGELVTFAIQAKTDLAEAYITTDSALQPMAMSQEELQSFLGQISQSAMMNLMGLISKLPESVQSIVYQMMGGGAQ